MSDSLVEQNGGSVAKTFALTKSTEADARSLELREHLQRLRLILPAITNAVAALRCQNADIDADVAYDLTEHACEPLDYEIQRIEYLLASHARRNRKREAQA